MLQLGRRISLNECGPGDDRHDCIAGCSRQDERNAEILSPAKGQIRPGQSSELSGLLK